KPTAANKTTMIANIVESWIIARLLMKPRPVPIHIAAINCSATLRLGKPTSRLGSIFRKLDHGFCDVDSGVLPCQCRRGFSHRGKALRIVHQFADKREKFGGHFFVVQADRRAARSEPIRVNSLVAPCKSQRDEDGRQSEI